jgi:hypothetical protein
MPTNSPWYRNRKVEWGKTNYEKYLGTKKKIKDRSLRNAARKKKWLKVWNPKEVDHKKWIAAGNGKANLRVISMKTNRQDWAKKATAHKKKKNDLFYV